VETNAELPVLVKGDPRPCCFCSGTLTFGALTYPDWGGRGFPLVWHSEPRCTAYREVPNTSAGVLELARQCGLS
jgi:hypothetical protein